MVMHPIPIQTPPPHYITYRKKAHPTNKFEPQGWEETTVSDTLNVFDNSEKRTPLIIAVATQQGGAEISTNDVCPTLTAAAGMSGNNQPYICKAQKPKPEAECYNCIGNRGGITFTITATTNAKNLQNNSTIVLMQ